MSWRFMKPQLKPSTGHGKVVARLVPTAASPRGQAAWLRLRGQGSLLAAPEESVIAENDFEAASARPR